MEPPDDIVRAAVEHARRSPCAKSKRGAVVFIDETRRVVRGALRIVGTGHNGPPSGISCDGTELCRASCRYRCEHAESRALMWTMNKLDAVLLVDLKACDLVHVKIGPDGELVAGGPPSCVPCAVRILDVGLGGVWLYETMPEEWCPHLDMLRTECPLCQGEACDMCHPGFGRPICEHDVLDRHDGHPIVDARWRRYTAAEFHRSTCRRERVHLGP